jgi:hypothetical protein
LHQAEHSTIAIHFHISKDAKIETYRSTLVPVLYGCGTWSVILMEEDGLRMFGNYVLRRMFGLKRGSNESKEKTALLGTAKFVLFIIGTENGAACEPGSSVSVVSGYRLDNWAIEVRSSAETKGFFL